MYCDPESPMMIMMIMMMMKMMLLNVNLLRMKRWLPSPVTETNSSQQPLDLTFRHGLLYSHN